MIFVNFPVAGFDRFMAIGILKAQFRATLERLGTIFKKNIISCLMVAIYVSNLANQTAKHHNTENT